MKLRFYLTFIALSVFTFALSAYSQALDTAIGQITDSTAESLAGSISGNGRFVVFESRGDVATENPRNADGNLEVFLWDLAQRRIFQITDTKNLLFDTTAGNTLTNVRVVIQNTRAVISNDGKWIAFSSNATIAFPGDGTPEHPPVISTTNPGSFDANAFTAPVPTPSPSPSPSPTPGANSLTFDGNMEMWLYKIPVYADVPDLSAGDEISFTNLAPFNADGSATAGASFVRVTNTFPSQLPRPGTATSAATVANDNHDVSINDDGSVIAFVSSRDLIVGGNTFPNDDNDEIFTFVNSGAGQIKQVTKTGRGTFANPIYSKFPSISGNGSRVAFASTGDDPVLVAAANPDCGSNPESSRNEEIFYADLAGGAATACKQITTTTQTNPGDIVNILDPGKRISRDGRYIAFDSFADLAASGPNQTSFALYVYDASIASGNAFRQIGPRSTADSAATGGDIAHYPGFTDTDAMGAPSTLVLETRLNIKPDGTVPATASDGMNPDPTRPTQIYSYSLSMPPASATFKRLTKLPISQVFLASTQPLPSNTSTRLAFNLALTEIGTGNPDLQSEVYYLVSPVVISESAVNMNFATGASRIPVSPSPQPTPSPSATPTPSPTPTPSVTPTPVPTPTPITPPAVQGVSPGMLAILNFQAGLDQPVVARTAVGDLKRSFTLPMELSGITLTINGAACGLKSVSRHSIVFVVPPGLTADAAGTAYPVVLNNNGSVLKSTVVVVPARPDIFTFDGVAPGGRAKVFNVTNRVPTTEPFTVFTVMIRGGRRVPSHLRLYLTGVENAGSASFAIRIGSVTLTGTNILSGAVAVEPGVYTVDFALPSTLAGAGDQPIIVTVTSGGVGFSSRLDDTASRLFIL